MVKRWKIIWDDEAKNSLRSIYDYIKNRESASMALRVRKEIIKQVKSLATFPEKLPENHTFSLIQEIFDSKLSGVTRLYMKLQMAIF